MSARMPPNDYALICAACERPDSGPDMRVIVQGEGEIGDAYVEIRCSVCGEHWTAKQVRVRFTRAQEPT